MTRVPHRPELLAREDLPPAPRQQRSREKRAQLLAAGLALFGEKGYEAASVDEIAARAGVAIGGFYQHFRSKRQLLLVLMDGLLERLSKLDLRPKAASEGQHGSEHGSRRGGKRGSQLGRKNSSDIRAALRALLKGAFAADLAYTGAYRAWQEAVLLDASLAPYQKQIERWTRARVTAVFELLLNLPGARADVDVPVLARLIDRLFWDLLGQALRLSAAELGAVLEAVTHLLYHALFTD